MPLSDRHKQQKTKNYTILILMLIIVAIFFGLTLIKIS